MSDQDFHTLDMTTLDTVHGGCPTGASGGMDPNARWIMQRESNGRTGVKNPTSSAFGAFQMIKANRKKYMGANWQSTSLQHQYAGASAYVRDRYGSWANAKRFWQRNHWY
jgi:hypothetical protein